MVDLVLLEQGLYFLIQELFSGVGLKPHRDAWRRLLEQYLKSFDHIAGGFGLNWEPSPELRDDIDYTRYIFVARVSFRE